MAWTHLIFKLVNYGWNCVVVWESDLSYKARQGELSYDDKEYILGLIKDQFNGGD